MYIDSMIQSLSKDKTFVDIGPCWGIINEKLSVAHKAGAKTVTAIDIFPEYHQQWQKLNQRLKDLKVDCIKKPSLNFFDYDGEPFDIVYCSGVAYHCADPFVFFKQLNNMTKEHLLLKSTVTPLKVGKFNIPDGASIFMPSLSEADRKIFAEDWKGFLKGKAAAGLTKPMTWDLEKTYWWWLFTPGSLEQFCRLSGFSIIDRKKITDRDYFIHAVKKTGVSKIF